MKHDSNNKSLFVDFGSIVYPLVKRCGIEEKDVDSFLIKMLNKYYNFEIENVESGTHDINKYDLKYSYSYPTFFRR